MSFVLDGFLLRQPRLARLRYEPDMPSAIGCGPKPQLISQCSRCTVGEIALAVPTPPVPSHLTEELLKPLM